jgi:3-phosphoshikimate 1-carboxyvinyltransferase
MTERLIEVFPKTGGEFAIEPDASSGSYFWAAGCMIRMQFETRDQRGEINPEKAPVRVARWPVSGWQIDAEFPNFIPLPDRISRDYQLGDSIMTAIVMAPDYLAAGYRPRPEALEFTELGRLRAQECERVTALRTELTKCGAKVEEKGDTLFVYRSQLHGAEVETYNDHRMAMCFAILGLKVTGIKIKNPA